jgi:NAD(P)-dependent dehydrogenase (short-subunit alcohol dehydrogenase family)
MPEALPLAGRHALITGGGRGIGAAIATELARLGADLTLLGRTAATLTARRDALRAEHQRCVEVVMADVTDDADLARAFAAARANLGPIGVLINNAGAADSGPFRRQSRASWDAMLAINLTAPALCAQQVVGEMTDAGWGRIVTIASTAGLKGYRYTAAYCAAKHGVVGLTRALALELATSGVTVNAVCPGFTDTDLVGAAVQNIVAKTGRDASAARADLAAFNPQGRLIDPAEVANVVAWLCLPQSASITGQAIVVAGGEV